MPLSYSDKERSRFDQFLRFIYNIKKFGGLTNE